MYSFAVIPGTLLGFADYFPICPIMYSFAVVPGTLSRFADLTPFRVIMYCFPIVHNLLFSFIPSPSNFRLSAYLRLKRKSVDTAAPAPSFLLLYAAVHQLNTRKPTTGFVHVSCEFGVAPPSYRLTPLFHRINLAGSGLKNDSTLRVFK